MGSARNIVRAMKRDKLIDVFEKGKYRYLSDSRRKYQQTKFRFTNSSKEKGIF